MMGDTKELKYSVCMYKTIVHRREIALRSKGISIAVEDIDDFVQVKLPILIRRRHYRHIVLDEYMRIAKWVELREIEDPPERGTYTKPSEDEVKYFSMNSFAVLAKDDTMQAMSQILRIPGCDTKVASAILSAADPTIPYQSEMLLEAMRKEKRGQTCEVRKMMCSTCFFLFVENVNNFNFVFNAPFSRIRCYFKQLRLLGERQELYRQVLLPKQEPFGMPKKLRRQSLRHTI